MNTGLSEPIQAWRDAFERGDDQLEGRLLKEAVVKCPECSEVWAVRAASLIWQGQRVRSRRALERSWQLSPNTAVYWAAVARIAAFEGKTDEALEAAEAALALEQTDTWVVLGCVDVFSHAQEFEKATAISASLREQWPKKELVWMRSVTTLRLAGQEKEAADVRDEAERRFPDGPLVLYMRAMAAYHAHRLEDAADLLRRAAADLPGKYMIWSVLAEVLSFMRLDKEAEAAARRALDICSSASNAMRAMWRVCRHRGDNQQAAKWRSKANRAIPALRSGAALARANARLRNGHYQSAISEIEESLAGMPAALRRPALMTKARAFLGLNKAAEAAESLQEAERLGSDASSLYELKGDVLGRQVDSAGAIAVLEEGLGRYPDSGAIRAQLLRQLYSAGLAQEADGIVEGCFAHLPQLPSGFAGMVMALEDTGYADESRQMLSLGLAHFPNADVLRLLAAMGRFELGDFEAARQIASDIKGPLRRVSARMDQAAIFIEQAKSAKEKRRKKQNPPTLN